MTLTAEALSAALADFTPAERAAFEKLAAERAIEHARIARLAAYPTPGVLAKAIEPSTRQTPALDLIDEALVKVDRGEIRRLIISMPPQEGKSERTSHYGTLWFLIRDPRRRVAIVSFDGDTASRWGEVVRNDLLTYNGDEGNIDLGLRVRKDSSAKSRWQLDGYKGGIYSVGIAGALTGRPVDLLIIDDPIKGRKEADSETYRNAAWNFWQGTARTRLAPGAPVILILTRWHEDDLAGRLLADDKARAAIGDPVEGWHELVIPAIADHNPNAGQTDPLGREPGEFMVSARGRTQDEWLNIKAGSDARTWASLYQGRPAPQAGSILLSKWWRFYERPMWSDDHGIFRVPDVDEVIQSWDMAFKDTRSSDFVVGQVWARRGAEAFLLDQVRERMDFVASCAAVQRLSAKWPQSNLKLIEDKANGPAVIAQLRKNVPGLVPIEPKDSKQARASAISPFVESGNVWLPDRSIAPWIDELVLEATAFPNGQHDDQVDTLTQALNRLLLRPGQGDAFIAAWKALAAKDRAKADPAALAPAT